MKKFSSGDLQTTTISLGTMHLGYAIDSMRKSKEVSKTAKTGWEKQTIKRCAISSILHGFCALEGVISLFGYEMFSDQDSQLYVPVEKRDYLLTKFLRSWDKSNVLEKLGVISSYSKVWLPEKINNELRELNNLRNWITHGFVYKTTYLLDLISSDNSNNDNEQAYAVADMEDSVDWKEKFPNTKFKSLDELDYDDAQTALTIVLDVLKIFSDTFSRPFSLITCEYPPNYQTLFKDSFDISEIVKLEYTQK